MFSLLDQAHQFAFRCSSRLSAWCQTGFVTSKWVVGLSGAALGCLAQLLAGAVDKDLGWHVFLCGGFILFDWRELRWAYDGAKEDREDSPPGMIPLGAQRALINGHRYVTLTLIWAVIVTPLTIVQMALQQHEIDAMWFIGLLLASGALRAFGMYAFVAPGGFGVHAAAPVEA